MMLTHKGEWIDLADPDPKKIWIADIAHGLSRTVRYGGQCPDLYTVAEHSVLVSAIAEEHGEDRHVLMECLLHDAPEAYLGDVITPIKKLIGQPYADLNARFEDSISTALGIPWLFDNFDGKVHVYDQIALACEMSKFWPHFDLETLGLDEAILEAAKSTNLDYCCDDSPLRHPFGCIDPDEAETLFLRRYESLI